MNEFVKITLDGEEYYLTFNDITGYYEITLPAPEIPGLHQVYIEYQSDEQKDNKTADLIVLSIPEKESITHEIIAYFLDEYTFEVVDIEQLSINSINRDLETNGNSIFYAIRKLNIKENDFIYLKKDDELNFLGIVQSQENENEDIKYKITCKDILAMFDFTSFIENEEIIKTKGIENFIANRISEEFITNQDVFFNRDYLSVITLTSTPINVSISSIANITDKTYNFLTFLGNCIETYGVNLNFILDKNKLKIEIYTRKDIEKLLVDTTTSDISNYSETFSLSIVAKVEVLIEETKNKYSRYLLSDRTTTEDPNNKNRVHGKINRKSVEKVSEAEQVAIDAFKSNSYSHNITFTINKKSTLHNVKELTLGTPIQIKTKNNVIHDTYISKIADSESNFITFSCGNIRVNYIDKFLQERRKSL